MVIAEDLFRDVLLRERKRAGRFNQPFVLVVVAANAGQSDPATWSVVVEALTAAKRDTDLLGWLDRGVVMGLLVPEIDAADLAFMRDVESGVSLALAARLSADTQRDFSIRLHQYAGPAPMASEGSPETEPVLRELKVRPRDTIRRAAKRLLDVIGSAALLLVISPLFLLIACLVKLKSPGPVFFRQARVGQHGKLFTMLKFRTMHVNNNDAIHKEFVSQLIKGTAPSSGDGNDAPFKIVADPRVTAIGRLLRKTSLDELPQFWNVLCGDMSLVGPRPPLTYEVEQYKPWHYRRVLEAKPGITGLWQVSGRSRTTFDDMVRLDLRYAKDCSAWTDIKILLATPRAVISGKGAV